MTAQVYIINGMDCADCASKITQGVSKLNGANAVQVDFITGKMRLEGDVSRDAIRARVEALGYSLAESLLPAAQDLPHNHDHDHAGHDHDGHTHDHDHRTQLEPQTKRVGILGFWDYLVSQAETRLALIGGGLIVVGLAANLLHASPTIYNGMFILALGIAAFMPAKNGLANLRINRSFSIDLLMVIAALGAILLGDILEGATVIFLFSVGEALEGFTADRARRSSGSLLDLAPTTAIRVTAKGDESVLVSALAVGDQIIIKPGERVPMDGTVISGESDVNQAPITGESVPIFKTRDAEVFAGSINGMGMLTVTVTHLAADNTLSRIVQMVEDAQSSRAPSQRFIDRFAAVYTPVIALTAMILAILPPLILNAPFWNTPTEQGWLYRALSLLVIACPCALVISAPVTVISGITGAARRGVLIKGGAHLESLATVRAIALDKTGTITTGTPLVMSTLTTSCVDADPSHVDPCEKCNQVLALANAVEQRSTHPLARAVTQEATKRGISTLIPAAELIVTLPGQGMRGMVNGQSITVGSHPFFDAEYPHDAKLHTVANSEEANGRTTMLVANGTEVQGMIALADAIRPESEAVIRELHNLQLATVMLTGDNAAVAQSVAAQVGVTDIRANMLPSQKLDAIHTLTSQYGSVAMIGDGINDTPALAASTVGVAIGGASSAQAMEAADVVLLANDLNGLPSAIRIARFTTMLIKQNVLISLATKVFFLALALFGGASLWLAIFADVGVSLIVTLNGMRPLRYAAALKAVPTVQPK